MWCVVMSILSLRVLHRGNSSPPIIERHRHHKQHEVQATLVPVHRPLVVQGIPAPHTMPAAQVKLYPHKVLGARESFFHT